jgi:hypothetical protein
MIKQNVKSFYLVEILEDHVQLLVGVNDVEELDDVRMFKFFQERNLADGGARNALRLAEI